MYPCGLLGGGEAQNVYVGPYVNLLIYTLSVIKGWSSCISFLLGFGLQFPHFRLYWNLIHPNVPCSVPAINSYFMIYLLSSFDCETCRTIHFGAKLELLYIEMNS